MTVNRISLHELIIVVWISAVSAAAQISGDAPPRAEPPARIAVDQPLAEPLSRGVVVVPFRTQNLHVQPVFGPAAVLITPRAGHLHVSVDDAAWVWAHTSEEPVIVEGLAPGPHKVRAQLMNANHHGLDEAIITFEVPGGGGPSEGGQPVIPAVGPDTRPRLAKIMIDPPLPEPLSRGVVLVRYRVEPASPVSTSETGRVEHIRVRVDAAPFQWTDASGNPIIVQGLAPGLHKITIELLNAHDQVIDSRTSVVNVPLPAKHIHNETDHERDEN